MIKKLEALANIAVIITSIVLCSVLARKYFFLGNKQAVAATMPSTTSAFTNTPSRRTPQAGTKISLPGVDWSKSTRTVVLALSTTCHFCSESAPFYQNLVRQKPDNVGLIAVLPQPVQDSKNYLNQLGVKTTDVIQSSLSSIGASGTPTLLLVDNSGSITASWVGKLPDGEAAKVIEQIRE